MFLVMLPQDILEYCIQPFMTPRDIMFMNMAISFHEYDVNYYYYDEESGTDEFLDKQNEIDDYDLLIDDKYDNIVLCHDHDYRLSSYTIYEFSQDSIENIENFYF